MNKNTALMIAALIAATALPAFAADPSPSPAPVKKEKVSAPAKKAKAKAHKGHKTPEAKAAKKEAGK